MSSIGNYTIADFPSSRISTIDVGAASRRKNHIKALIEVDVTTARQRIAEKKALKETVSFNAWLIKCIGEVAEDFKDIHGIRKGKRKLVLFDDVDISIMIEKQLSGKSVPLPYIIRKVNEKSISEIVGETRAAQNQAVEDEGSYVLGEKKETFLMKLYYRLPGCFRQAVWRVIIGNPFVTKQNMGTVMVTSVGMMGTINGWIIPFSVHPLAFGVGSIVKKPGVKNDQIEIREYLYLNRFRSIMM